MSVKRNICIIMFMALLLVFMGGAYANDVDQASDMMADVDSPELISSDNQEVLSSEGDSFSDLQDEINTKDDVVLEKNYIFNDTKDNAIVINKEMIIDGNGRTIDANGKSNIFIVNSTGVTLKNLIFLNGNAKDGGAVYFNNTATAKLENCKFINTVSENGAVYFTGGDLTIDNCEFINSSTLLSQNIVSENDLKVLVSQYTGTSMLYVNSTGNINVSKSKFSNSKFSDYGIHIINATEVIFDGNTFEKNLAFSQIAFYNSTSDSFGEDNICYNYGDYKYELINIVASDIKFSNSEFKNETVYNILTLNSDDIDIENFTLENSVSDGEFNIVAKNSLTVNNMSITDMNHINHTNYYVGDFVYPFSKNKETFTIEMNGGNVSLSNITISNVIGGGEDGILVIICDNLTLNTISLENISPVNHTEIHYNSTFYFQKYTYYFDESNAGIYCIAENNVLVSNVKLDNVSSILSESSGGLSFECGNITVENISITNSNIADCEGSGFNIDARGNVIVKNVNVDNIGFFNITKFTLYADSSFEYENKKGDNDLAGFGINIETSKNATVSNINITNTCGPSYYGSLSVGADNVTLSDVILDNISQVIGFTIVNSTERGYYYSAESCSYEENFHVMAENTAKVSNVKLNAMYLGEGSFYIESNNQAFVNDLMITNTLPKIEFSAYYDDTLEEPEEEYSWYSEGMIEFSSKNTLFISGLIVENFPACTDEPFVLYGTNITLVNSLFRNINVYDYEHYFNAHFNRYYDLYNNQGDFLCFDGVNVSISNTTFENIKFGSDENSALLIYGNTLIDNCTFRNISADNAVEKDFDYETGDYYTEVYESHGSVLKIEGDLATVKDSRFINCNATYGGALYVVNPINITGSSFINCSAAKYGGAIYLLDAHDMNIINSVFEGNLAYEGGAIYFENQTYNNTISNTNFTRNNATHDGGAIYIFENDKDLNLVKESIFLGNRAKNLGGAFYFINALNNDIFKDYDWYNRTIMFSDDLRELDETNTKILASKFENNTASMSLNANVTGKNVTADENTTFIIEVPEGYDGNVSIVVEGEVLYNGTVNPTVICKVISAGNKIANVTFYGSEIYADKILEVPFSVKETLKANVAAENVTYTENTTFIIEVPEGYDGNVSVIVDGEVLYNGTVDSIITGKIIPAGSKVANVTFYGSEEFDDKSYEVPFIVKGELDVNVTARNVTYAENTTFIVEVPDNFNGNVSIVVDGEVVYNGTADSTIIGKILSAGSKVANVTFYGSDMYVDKSMEVPFVVKADLDVNVSAKNVTDDENTTFTIEGLSSDYDGNVSVVVDGVVVYNGTANPTIIGKILNSGSKTSNATFYGSDNYVDKSYEVPFIVHGDLDVNVTAKNVTVEENATFVLNLPPDFAGNVSVVVNGETLYNGTANPTIIGKILSAGNKTANLTFYGDEIYNDKSLEVNFTVFKLDLNANVTITNATTLKNATASFEVPSNFKGNVSVVVDNNVIYNGTVEDIDLGKFTEGDKVANVTFYGDENYADKSMNVNFTISKADLDANVTSNNATYNQNVTLNVTVPEDFKGNVSVVVNGETLYNGSATELIDIGKQNVGDGTAQVTFYSDENYAEKSMDVKFSVKSTIEAENLTRGWNSPYDYQSKFYDSKGNVLANTQITFIVDGKAYAVKTDDNGIAKLTDSKLAVGKYEITVINNATGENAKCEVTIVERLVENKDLTLDYRDGSKWTVRAIGDDGKPVGEGVIVLITTNGVNYKCKTDKNGYTRLLIELLPRSYKIVAEYKGYSVSNKLVVKQTLKVVKKTTKVKKSAKSFKLKATLKWSNGKGIKGKTIVFKIKGKKYKAKTNKKGVATVKIKKNLIKKLKKGKKYTVKVSYIDIGC